MALERAIRDGATRPKVCGSDWSAKNCPALRRTRFALGDAGVEFIAENGGGPGVRLRKRLI